MKRFLFSLALIASVFAIAGSLPSVASADESGGGVVTMCLMSPNGYFPGQLIQRDMSKAQDFADYMNGLSNEDTSWLMNFFGGLFGMDPPDVNPEFEVCTEYDFAAPNGCFCTTSPPVPPSNEDEETQYCFVAQGASALGTVVTQRMSQARVAGRLFNNTTKEESSVITDFFGWIFGTTPAPDLEYVPRACRDFSDAGGGQCKCNNHNTGGLFDSPEGEEEEPPPDDSGTKEGRGNSEDDVTPGQRPPGRGGHGNRRR